MHAIHVGLNSANSHTILLSPQIDRAQIFNFYFRAAAVAVDANATIVRLRDEEEKPKVHETA